MFGWIPNPRWGYTCKSLFSLLLDLAPLKESFFDVVWRTKVPKKVRFFIWQVLLGLVITVDRLVRRTLLVGPFCCILCPKVEEDLYHHFWESQFVRAMWSSFLQEFGVSFSGLQSIIDKRGLFYGLPGCARLFGAFEAREMIECFVVGRGGILRFWSWLDFTSLWASITNNFCNYSMGNILLSWSFF